jgi:hypothetical protein
LSGVDKAAQEARACPSFDEARRLATWLGAGRPVTPKGVLRPGDVPEVAQVLGAMVPSRFRSAADLPWLHEPWDVALDCGFVVVEGTVARAGEALAESASASDEAVLGLLTAAATQLKIAPSTLLRWLNDGFVVGEQITPGAPWRIRLTDDLRGMLVDDAPEGWLAIQYATRALGVSRQTILQRVKRGELQAVLTRTRTQKRLTYQGSPTPRPTILIMTINERSSMTMHPSRL